MMSLNFLDLMDFYQNMLSNVTYIKDSGLGGYIMKLTMLNSMEIEMEALMNDGPLLRKL